MLSETKTDKIVNELYRRITEGIYKAGEQLPSERELATELKITRATIRTALLRLQSENAIDIIPSKGIFVRRPLQKTVLGPRVHSKQKNYKNEQKFPASEIFVHNTTIRYMEPPTMIVAPEQVAFVMDLPPSTEVRRDYCLYLVDNIPYRSIDSYSVLGVMDIIALTSSQVYHVPMQHDDLSLELLDSAEGSMEVYERINCRMPQAQEADTLKISRTQIIFDIERRAITNDGRTLVYTKIIANAALHEITHMYNKTNM